MSELKVGDRVEYVGVSSPSFTRGKIYTVGGKFHEYMGNVGVEVDDEGDQNGQKVSYFRLAPNSPVRTETITRTVIEPGVYGRLWVDNADTGTVWVNLVTVGGNFTNRTTLNATELRELARIATELADGLDAQ